MQLEYVLTVVTSLSKYKIKVSFAKTVAHFLMWRKIMMSEYSCRSVCRYYDAEAEFRNSGNGIFRKYCTVCDLELVSRYSNCPYGHKSFEEVRS